MNGEIMTGKNNINDDAFEIDLVHIFSVLWQKAWIVILSAVLGGAMCFSWAAFMITPKYSSTFKMYVNNISELWENTHFTISAAEIAASQGLVNTYLAILQTRETMTEVAELAKVNYSYNALLGMISAKAPDDTMVFSITVTAADPYEAQRIADAISDVLKRRGESIVEGSSMKLVDKAVVSKNKVSPNVTKYTILGIAVGIMFSCAALIVIDFLDDMIRDDTYILKTYNIPILSRVPDLLSEEPGRYGYYGGQGNKRRSRENR